MKRIKDKIEAVIDEYEKKIYATREEISLINAGRNTARRNNDYEALNNCRSALKLQHGRCDCYSQFINDMDDVLDVVFDIEDADK